MISKTSEYALRAVLYLAESDAKGSVRASEIAEAIGVPANYLSKILHQLARSGILTSERGPAGGFRLAKPASELPLVKVIDAFEGLSERRKCLLGRKECSDESPCAVHEEWKNAYGPVLDFFSRTTIADLV